MDWELIVSVIFLGAMLYLAYSGGKANPMTTGKLKQEIDVENRKLADDIHIAKNQLMSLEQQLKGTASKEDVERLRSEMKDSATSDDVKEIGGQVNTVCAKVEGLEGAIERTDRGVQRLEHYFLKKGTGGR